MSVCVCVCVCVCIERYVYITSNNVERNKQFLIIH